MNIIDILYITTGVLLIGTCIAIVMRKCISIWETHTFVNTLNSGVSTLPEHTRRIVFNELIQYTEPADIILLRKYNYVLPTIFRYVKSIGKRGIYPGGMDSDGDGGIILYYAVGVTIGNPDKNTPPTIVKIAIGWRQTNVIKKDIVHRWQVHDSYNPQGLKNHDLKIHDIFYNWSSEERQDMMSDNAGDLLNDIVGQIFPWSRFTISDGCDV